MHGLQVKFSEVVNATLADDGELQCVPPSVSFVAPIRVEVSLNGQQYGTGGPLFNCHSPRVKPSTLPFCFLLPQRLLPPLPPSASGYLCLQLLELAASASALPLPLMLY